MLQVRRGRQRFDRRVGKSFGEDAAQASAELLARDAYGGARRIGAQELQAPRLCAAESPDLQHDPILRLFADAQNSARQIIFSGPEVDEGILAIAMEFAVQRGKFREPFAVIADFGAPGCRHRDQSAVEFGPIVHIQTTTRLETVAARLFQDQAGDADRRILLIPLGGNTLFNRDLKFALLPHPQRRIGATNRAFGFAQDDLMEGIVEFDRHLNCINRPRAAV